MTLNLLENISKYEGRKITWISCPYDYVTGVRQNMITVDSTAFSREHILSKIFSLFRVMGLINV